MAIGGGRQLQEHDPDDRRAGCIGKIAKGLGAVAVIALLSHLIFALLGPKDTPTAEEAAKQKLSKQQSMAVSTAVQMIKESLRNPASADWVRVTASKDGSIVCVTVRAQNGFGGMSIGQYSAHEYHLSQSTAQWNQYCAGRALEDLTQAVRMRSE
jgi:hypothetical protein